MQVDELRSARGFVIAILHPADGAEGLPACLWPRRGNRQSCRLSPGADTDLVAGEKLGPDGDGCQKQADRRQCCGFFHQCAKHKYLPEKNEGGT